MLVITGLDKKILFLSKSYIGTVHDFSILKTVPPPHQDWFINHSVRLDLGFQGFADHYTCKEVFLPAKKPRKAELSEENKQVNKEQAAQRVVVEHSIGGLKRYRVLSNTLRTKDAKLYDRIAGICAALWNLNIDTNH
jgi:DDE superfamily endonuclease